MKKTTILLVDDHSFLRMGIRSLLATQADLSIVGEASNGLDAVELATRLKPNVVIMDLVMPALGGAEATRLIRNATPKTKVLVLTSFGTSSELRQALAYGATGALLKDAESDDLLAAIRKVADGGTAIAVGIGAPPLHNLGKHHLEILRLVARGLSNVDIATQVGLSEVTVKKHLTAIYRKLEVANRAEAVSLALQEGLIQS